MIAPTDPPPRYDEYDSGDEYYSEDDLSYRDINLLNTDYALQKEFNFNPAALQRNQQHNPSSPPGLGQYCTSGDDIHLVDTHERNSGTPAPPHTTPVHQNSIYNGRLRTNDYKLPQHKTRAYQSYRKRRPLVDLIRNEWRNNIYTQSSSPPPPGKPAPSWIQVCSAPRFRRYVLLLLMLLSLSWGNWHYWAGPRWSEHRRLSQSLHQRMRSGEGWFGENTRPEFLDMVQVKLLDRDLVPQIQGSRKRLVVIGDVHGCNEERKYINFLRSIYETNMIFLNIATVENLLAQVQFEARTDHLIFAGDFISSGPSSPAVVDLALAARASCVRGNHEDRVLLAYRDLDSHRLTLEQKGDKVSQPPAPGMPEDMRQNDRKDDYDGLEEEESFPLGDTVDRHLAQSFTKRQIDYMASCPVILDVGQVKGMGDVHVVHAGLIAGVRLERQDPIGVMHMRTVDLDTHVPSSSAKGTPWFKVHILFPSDPYIRRRSTSMKPIALNPNI